MLVRSHSSCCPPCASGTAGGRGGDCGAPGGGQWRTSCCCWRPQPASEEEASRQQRESTTTMIDSEVGGSHFEYWCWTSQGRREGEEGEEGGKTDGKQASRQRDRDFFSEGKGRKGWVPRLGGWRVARECEMERGLAEACTHPPSKPLGEDKRGHPS